MDESVQRIYDGQSSSSPLVFTQPKPAHEEIIRRIILRNTADGEVADDERPDDEDPNESLQNDFSVMSIDSMERKLP